MSIDFHLFFICLDRGKSSKKKEIFFPSSSKVIHWKHKLLTRLLKNWIEFYEFQLVQFSLFLETFLDNFPFFFNLLFSFLLLCVGVVTS